MLGSLHTVFPEGVYQSHKGFHKVSEGLGLRVQGLVLACLCFFVKVGCLQGCNITFSRLRASLLGGTLGSF